MLEEIDTGKKDASGNPIKTTKLWDANAIERVDDHTFKMNLKIPQIAVPEHLFHYPLLILDPEEGGKFDAGSNGTGPFELVTYDRRRKAVLKGKKDYWGDGPYLDTLQFIDVGDDPAAAVAAIGSNQIDGLYLAFPTQVDALDRMNNLQRYEATTAETVVCRG